MDRLADRDVLLEHGDPESPYCQLRGGVQPSWPPADNDHVKQAIIRIEPDVPAEVTNPHGAPAQKR